MRFALALLLVISICACQKKQCWQCRHTFYDETANRPDTTVSPMCDMTKKEVRSKEYEILIRVNDTFSYTERFTCN